MSSPVPRILKIDSVRCAEKELTRIGADAPGIARMAPKMLHSNVLLSGLQCRQANIIKQEMLALGADAAVARGTVSCSLESTDVLLMGTRKQLTALCSRLSYQPFSLSSVAAEIELLLATLQPHSCVWKTSKRSIDLTGRVAVMGILNVTPDSFSDGGRHLNPSEAVERAFEMADQGADIIDIGGESTRPGAVPVSVREELDRVIPVIEKLSGRIGCALSIDTWKSEVARAALASGAEIVNDISGFTFDAEMLSVVAETGAAAVVMHTSGRPDRMQEQTAYSDIMGEIHAFFSGTLQLAEAAGIERHRIALDPGIGFGKTREANLKLISRLSEFRSLGIPLLVGPSRKSFIGASLGRGVEERLFGTAAAVSLAVANGASVVRVHDVREMRDVADMAFQLAASACDGD